MIAVPKDEPPSLFFITQSDVQRTSIIGDPWNSTSMYKVRKHYESCFYLSRTTFFHTVSMVFSVKFSVFLLKVFQAFSDSEVL